MDQTRIGRFIAECRRAKNLTQMQLGDQLGITDKAVSKWERGIAMPDSSIMLELCGILDISVNELLSGERGQVLVNFTNEEVSFALTGSKGMTIHKTGTDYEGEVITDEQMLTLTPRSAAFVLEKNVQSKPENLIK